MAGMTAGEIDKMSLSLSRMSTFDDEAIKSSSALLLTFTRVSQDVFPQAQKAILNLATMMEGDLQGATIMVGKALNDPISGMTALKKAGIQLSDQQKEQVRDFMALGDVASAQKIILGELSTEFRGQAAAAANTYQGQLKQLNNEIGNLGEAIGKEALPELKEFVRTIKDATIWTVDNYGKVRTAVGWYIDLSKAMMNITMPITMIGDQISNMNDAWDDLAGSTNKADKAAGQHSRTIDTQLIPSLQAEADAAEAASDANRGMIDTIGDIQSIEENYQDTIEDIEKRRADLAEDRLSDLAKNEAAMMKNAAAREKIDEDDADALERNTERARELALEREEIEKRYRESMSETTQAVRDNEEAYRKANLEIISGLVERKLMQDGVLDDKEFEWLLQKRQEWGIYSADVVEKARAAWTEADMVTASFQNIPDVTTKTININTVYGHSAGGAVEDGMSGGSAIGGHSQGGADFWSQAWNQFNGGDNGDTGLFSQGFAGLGASQANYLQSMQTANVQQAQNVVAPGQSFPTADDIADALARRGVGR